MSLEFKQGVYNVNSKSKKEKKLQNCTNLFQNLCGF